VVTVDPLRPGDADPEAYYPGSGGRVHPGPPSVSLRRDIRHAIVEHARGGLPNEACGLIAGTAAAANGGEVTRWYPTRNALESPYRYEIDADDLLRTTIEIDDRDEVVWAIVHSHVASPARPSPTDVRQATYPEALYLVVSLDAADADATTGVPGIRAWRIVDGTVHEVEVRDDLSPPRPRRQQARCSCMGRASATD
jgi:[CysO sulfur-carrier protein]-S-L-cysteine hydrolase